MPNPPFVARLDRLDAEIAYLEGEIAAGRALPGMQGRLRLLARRRTWYFARTTPKEAGGPRLYRFAQPWRRRMPTTPPELVVDIRAL